MRRNSNTMNMKKELSNTIIIPGLTPCHFTYLTSSSTSGNSYNRCILLPILTKAKIYPDGKNFYFCWTTSNNKEKYYMQATGSIPPNKNTQRDAPKWWGFECRCSCKDFSKQEERAIRENYMVNYVCNHLHLALRNSCFDPKTTAAAAAAAAAPAPVAPVAPPPPPAAAAAAADEKKRMPLRDIIIIPKRRTNSGEHQKKVTIPGLTENHFIWEKSGGLLTNSTSTPSCCTPIATKVLIDANSGEFNVHWKVPQRRVDDISLRATGNIKELERSYGSQQWWGFTVSCSCSTFLKQRHRCDASGWTENFVCHHLGSALKSSIDKNRGRKMDYDEDSTSSVNATILVAAVQASSVCSRSDSC